MNKFAKLFESEKYGQLVVILQSADEGNPEIRLFFKPSGLGVCSIAASFKDDSEQSWESCEKIFNDFTIETAEGMAAQAAMELEEYSSVERLEE
jgi:hypothetical protein